ncbi:cytochrome P450 family protein [Mycobacterium intracellulare 1956]|uniref:Cytochrome P450 family protein n=1 Tax=Mycobacterium intracellulare 1956 TaxID=1299331 RepID=X8CQ81_MYCIT|nr:cytochrome P450 family protein [Mycobacterium intracellulare 1956]
MEFDPFSEDFFNGSYETYRRMREEARSTTANGTTSTR